MLNITKMNVISVELLVLVYHKEYLYVDAPTVPVNALDRTAAENRYIAWYAPANFFQLEAFFVHKVLLYRRFVDPQLSENRNQGAVSLEFFYVAANGQRDGQ